ncbi:hypothetical protein Trydic_g18223 [Trypoxylus dichotomus]
MSSFGDKCIPAIVIMLFLFTYYGYVVELCLFKISVVLKRILYLVVYHLCIIPIMIHYFTTMCIRSDPVPDSYRFGAIEVNALSRMDPNDKEIDMVLQRFCYFRGIRTYTRKNNRIRYCMKCRQIKPDRTHHCSTCQICVLKMDHHCPWIDNCIHFDNYKIFFLLLIHTSIYCFYYTGIAVTALFGFHLALMLRNQTTLEALNEPVFVENCTFDLGPTENFFEVFGYNCCLWFLPLPSALGNGVNFPIRYY